MEEKRLKPPGCVQSGISSPGVQHPEFRVSGSLPAVEGLLDIDSLAQAFEHFFKVTGLSVGLLSHPGRSVLIYRGWRKVCSRFHHQYPESAALCRESTQSAVRMAMERHEPVVHTCALGLTDAAAPVLINGSQAATLVLGQVFLAKPDMHRFSLQGQTFGYPVEDYLEALSRVPVVTEQQVLDALAFMGGMVSMMAQLGLSKQKAEANSLALRETELKHQTMLDSIEEGFSELDLKGSFVFANDAMCRIHGMTREEMIGVNYREYTTPETGKRLFTVFNKIFRTGAPAKIVDYQIIRKDGSTAHLQLSAMLMTTGGQPSGFRCICRDITHLWDAQREKDKLEKKLWQAQKLEAIGTLAGGVAHDFNNLLMGLQGNVSLALRELDPRHPCHERIRSMEEYIVAATGLTRQLLGFARAGKYEVKTTDVNELVDKTASMFGRARKEVRIHKDFKAAWPSDVDAGQMEQVLLNLYVNAWQAMPDGGDLYLQTQDIILDDNYVQPFELKPGNYVKISVTDTGIGMDEATAQKVFDPFFTTKDLNRGTGLGLSSAYGIVKNHQGVITVYSAPGKGATFNIYLPASEKSIRREEKAQLGVVYGSETILLVDDEQVIIKTGGEILKALGYTPILASRAREAIEIFQEKGREIDLVILDMIMPDMTGGQVYDHLKRMDPNVRVLLSSGYSLNGQAVDIMRKGCNGFIQKPFNLEQLSNKLREILDAGAALVQDGIA